MMTPEQAKTLWCPMARVAQAGHTDTHAAYNRTLTKHHAEVTLHVVQDPSKFQLGEDHVPEQRTELVMQHYVNTSLAAKCLADGCAMWRWGTNGNHEHDCAITRTPLTQQPPRVGYCGLAGRPEVAA